MSEKLPSAYNQTLNQLLINILLSFLYISFLLVKFLIRKKLNIKNSELFLLEDSYNSALALNSLHLITVLAPMVERGSGGNFLG